MIVSYCYCTFEREREKKKSIETKDVNLERSFDKPLRFQSISIGIMHSLENAIRNYLHIAVFEARIFFVPSLRFVCACLINYGFGCVFWIGLDDPYQAVENLPNAKTQWKKGVLSIQITIYVWAMSDMWLVWRDSISMRDSIPIPILLWQTSQ